VERKIFFYRADAGQDQAGRPRPYDPVPVLQQIDALRWDPNGRYWDVGDGRAAVCWVDSLSLRPAIRFGITRRSGLPQVEDHGQLAGLPIPPTSGLAEVIHVVFFPQNIAAAEFNFYGPRMSRLAGYLAVKASHIGPRVAFEPLLRLDVRQQLGRLSDVRLLELKIHAPYSDTVKAANKDLGAAFDAAARAGNAEEVTIILSPKARSRRQLSSRLLRTVRRLAVKRDLREEALRFRVRGLDELTERVETVDILRDELISTKRIVRADDKSRALDATSAYEAIQEAYDELRDQLRSAASVQP
jgi:hypothetical protein